MLLEKIKKFIALGEISIDLKVRRIMRNGILSNPDGAIWFFGCSHVFAADLELHESSPEQLATLLNISVINFGVPGSGPMMVEHLIDKLLKKHKPLAVVIAWPGFNRWQTEPIFGVPLLWLPTCLYQEYTHIHNDHFGCKKLWPKEWNHYKNIVASGELEHSNLEVVNRVRDKLRGFQLVEFQYMQDPAIDLPSPVYPFLDNSIDGIHAGPITQHEIAKWVKEQLLV